MPENFSTDEILWYNNGKWGELGYACPNFGNDVATLNTTIHYLTEVMGRNLSAIMHHTDTWCRVPPSINTLVRIHKLVTRARQIIGGRALPANKPNFESIHSTPAPLEYIIFPVPYFRCRNIWLKEYCGLVLNCLAECFQHTENHKAYEISRDFGGLVGQYLGRVYRLMATELLQVPPAIADDPAFVVTDQIFQSYDPSKYFTATELIDTVPPLLDRPTEDDALPLTDGIPASLLVGLSRWPAGRGMGTTGVTSTQTGSAAQAAVPAFPAAPGV